MSALTLGTFPTKEGIKKMLKRKKKAAYFKRSRFWSLSSHGSRGQFLLFLFPLFYPLGMSWGGSPGGRVGERTRFLYP